MRFTNLPSNSSAINSATMKRFMAMQDCPLLNILASTALVTAAFRSALEITSNAPRLGIDTSIDTVVQLSDQLFGPLWRFVNAFRAERHSALGLRLPVACN
jgi:hypothetical protein